MATKASNKGYWNLFKEIKKAIYIMFQNHTYFSNYTGIVPVIYSDSRMLVHIFRFITETSRERKVEVVYRFPCVTIGETTYQFIYNTCQKTEKHYSTYYSILHKEPIEFIYIDYNYHPNSKK